MTGAHYELNVALIPVAKEGCHCRQNSLLFQLDPLA